MTKTKNKNKILTLTKSHVTNSVGRKMTPFPETVSDKKKTFFDGGRLNLRPFDGCTDG